jgi:hypothetical protein
MSDTTGSESLIHIPIPSSLHWVMAQIKNSVIYIKVPGFRVKIYRFIPRKEKKSTHQNLVKCPTYGLVVPCLCMLAMGVVCSNNCFALPSHQIHPRSPSAAVPSTKSTMSLPSAVCVAAHKKHPLKLISADGSSSCDSCGNDVKGQAYGCKGCEFDLCRSCAFCPDIKGVQVSGHKHMLTRACMYSLQ